MDYSTMVTAISTELNYQTRYDTEIPNKLKQAIKNFETRLDLPYMRVELPVEIDAGESEILVIDALENKSANYTVNQVKKIRYLGFPSTADTETNMTWLKRIDPQDILSLDSDDDSLPTAYWQKNLQTIALDHAMSESFVFNTDPATAGRMGVVLYTDFTKIINTTQASAFNSAVECQEEYDARCWLLANAERALILRACLNFASTIRDEKLMAMWKLELYGDGSGDTKSEWDLLVDHCENFDAENTEIYLNPDNRFVGK